MRGDNAVWMPDAVHTKWQPSIALQNNVGYEMQYVWLKIPRTETHPQVLSNQGHGVKVRCCAHSVESWIGKLKQHLRL